MLTFGLGGSPLEAMACGIPVVGADVGALRWAIQSEVTGFLVPAGDSTAVAERLARFRRNPELGRVLRARRHPSRARGLHLAPRRSGARAGQRAVLAPLHSPVATAASR
jgi:glycosyltransferase involved in cell wall biosynthesis